jgi:hypothetical protein
VAATVGRLLRRALRRVGDDDLQNAARRLVHRKTLPEFVALP